jgi:hypothetical protein
MKRIYFLVCALFFCLISGAQNPLYTRIKEILLAQHPELSTTDKLIAFNTWSLEDVESRERNKSFDNTYDIYYGARLKGGLKGLVVVSIHMNGTTATAATTMYHDGIRKLVLIDSRSLNEELKGAPVNIVFDSTGNEVYRNLGPSDVGSAINKLITR